MTKPPTLYLSSPAVPGLTYHLTPLIGNGLVQQTAVCQRFVQRETWYGNGDRPGEFGFEYIDELYEFADAATGELFTWRVEVTP